MTPRETVGVLLLIAIGAFVVIALLVLAPTWARDARYRPGLTWTADPVWFNGPGEVSDLTSEGGVPRPAAQPSPDGGGCSATW